MFIELSKKKIIFINFFVIYDINYILDIEISIEFGLK